jgi:hypothetical protein
VVFSLRLELIFFNRMNFVFQSVHTDCCDGVVYTPDSCAGGFVLKTSAQKPAILRFSWFSSVRSVECQGSTLKLNHDPLLQSPFQFIINL